MSNREKIQYDLSAYLDGELTAERTQQVRQALDQDPALSAEMDGIRAVRDLLAALPRTRAPHELADSVLRRAERASLVEVSSAAAGRRPFQWMRYLAAAAMLAVATTLGVMMYAELWPEDVPTGPAVSSARDETPAPLSGAAKTGGDTDKTGHAAGKNGRNTGAGVMIASKDRGEEDLSGRAARYGKGMAPKGARGGGIVRLGNLPEGEINEVIYTPAVAHTQRQIEKLLTRNAIQPVVMASTSPAPAKPAPRLRGRGNHYHAFRVTADQVRIRIDAATPEQIERIRAEIERIRTQQRVCQVAIPGEAIALHRPPDRPDGREPARSEIADEEKKLAEGHGQGTGQKAPTDETFEHAKVKSDGDAAVGKAAGSGGAKRTGPQDPAADGTGAGRMKPKTRQEDSERRRAKGQAAPAGPDSANAPGGRAVAQDKPGPARKEPDRIAERTAQQQIDDSADSVEQVDVGTNVAAVRPGRDAAGFKDLWAGFFGGEGGAAKRGVAVAAKPVTRPAKAPAQSGPGDGPVDMQEGQAIAARQVGGPTSQVAQGRQRRAPLAGANVRAMVITLNFRPVTDDTMRGQVDAAQKDAAVQNKALK